MTTRKARPHLRRSRHAAAAPVTSPPRDGRASGRGGAAGRVRESAGPRGGPCRPRAEARTASARATATAADVLVVAVGPGVTDDGGEPQVHSVSIVARYDRRVLVVCGSPPAAAAAWVSPEQTDTWISTVASRS